MTSSDFQVEISREFPTPRDVVFRVLHEPEFVQRWFFPRKDVVLTIEQFDFVPNGRYRFLYALPDGTLSKDAMMPSPVCLISRPFAVLRCRRTMES